MNFRIRPRSRRTFLRAASCVVLPLLALTAVASAGPDWQRTLTSRPGRNVAMRPMTADYSFGWSGVKAADATARFSKSKGKFVLGLSARTSGVARTLWRMDSEGRSVVDASTLRPVKLEQTEKYSRNTISTTVDFSPEGARRLKVETPSETDKPNVKSFKFGNVHDLHSAFLFIRSQRLKTGDTLRLCVYPGTSPYLADVKVGARETVKAAQREWTAIPCEIRLRRINKDFELADYNKCKTATVWLSDDPDRLVLRIEAEVYVGRIWAELERVTFAGKAATAFNE